MPVETEKPTPVPPRSPVGNYVEEILKNDWKEKKPYASVHFIGDPIWVKLRSQALKEEIKLKRKESIKRSEEKFKKAHDLLDTG